MIYQSLFENVNICKLWFLVHHLWSNSIQDREATVVYGVLYWTRMPQDLGLDWEGTLGVLYTRLLPICFYMYNIAEEILLRMWEVREIISQKCMKYGPINNTQNSF